MAATHESAVVPGSSATFAGFPPATTRVAVLPYCEQPAQLPECPRTSHTDRESRNLAEKQRRNTLNQHIKELAVLVPCVLHSQRKIDKTGTLRLAANDLRKEHVFGKSIRNCHLELPPARVLSLLDLLGGFVLTITCKGIITVVSPNVQNYLGHCQVDLLGQNLYSLVHPDDARALERHIYPAELRAASADSDDGDHADIYEKRREFFVRIVRASPRSEPLQYELCRVDGLLRRADNAAPPGMRDEQQVIRRQRVRRDRTFSSSGNDVVFNGMVRLAPRLSNVYATFTRSHTEYWTRHLVDGRIVQCDQGVSLIAGYMAEDVIGVSGFTFMHKEDVRWVVFLLRQMYDQSKACGESCYRFVTASGQFIYLMTRGYLEVDEKTKAVKSFVCRNMIVSDEEGQQYLEDVKRKYSVLVQTESEDLARRALKQDEPVIEDPRQLEQVIMHLVTNLPSPGKETPCSEDGSCCLTEVSAAPPQETLTIIPPEPATIGLAIRKSVGVISQTGVKLTVDERVRYESKVTENTDSKLDIERINGKRRAECDSEDAEAPKRRNKTDLLAD